MRTSKTERGGLISPDDPGEIGMAGKPRGSITSEEAQVLSEISKDLDVLEVGTGLGELTLALLHQAKRVVTVDIDPWVKREIWPSLASSGAECLEAIPVSGRFDLAFIDGNHAREQVRDDISAVLLVLARPGILLIHDMHLQGVQDGCREAGLTVATLRTPLSLGLAVVA